MNTIFEQKFDPAPAPNSRSSSRSVNEELSEARHRLLPASTNVPALHKAARAVRNPNRLRQVFAGSSELVEEAFYWFLTAPALAYVVYAAFGF